MSSGDLVPVTFDSALKFVGTLDGRDKLCKVMQYGSRVIQFHLLSADPKSELGLRLLNLYKGTSTARKCFRLGKFLNEGKKLLSVLEDESKSAEKKILATIAQSALMIYWYNDSLVYFSKVKAIKTDSAVFAVRGARFWFVGLVINIYLAFVEVIAAKKKHESAKRDGKEQEAAMKLNAKRRSLVKLCFDMIVCLYNSQFSQMLGIPLNDSSVGIAGLFSAFLTIYDLWPRVK